MEFVLAKHGFSAREGGFSVTRGIFFLANDAVYEITVAFLNSLRLIDPTIRLCMIPFDAQIAELMRISNSYDFSIFNDLSLLERCDHISCAFHGVTMGHYRKLVAWEGPFDEFIYIDVDTIVLEDVSCAFQFLARFDFILSHSRMPSIRRFVWKDSVFQSSDLSSDQINYSANTGFLCSTKHALTLQTAERSLYAALQLAPHMELRSFEQPFLNYLIVTSGLPYTSLYELRTSHGYQNLPSEAWAGTEGGVVKEGKITFAGRGRILLVHWAGNWMRKTSRQTAGDDPSNCGSMPYETLWRFYRDLRPPPRESPR